MTDAEHDIKMHTYRIEHLEGQLKTLTENGLALTENVRVTNAAVRTFHDTQVEQSKRIEEHDKIIGEFNLTRANIRWGWNILSFIGGAAASAAIIGGFLLEAMKQMKGKL